MIIFELPHLPPSVYMAAAVSFGVAVLLVVTKSAHTLRSVRAMG